MHDPIKADWLGEPALQAVFDALEQEGDAARVVGGAVRNTLLGVAVSDIDIATTAEPATVIRRVEAAGLKAVPTGVDHGTVTVVSEGRAFEVTTLREDVETHGRHATVRFGRDWQHDAARRDFTMNALYAARDGTLFDPVGGLPDLHARRVRFIGEADRRIREDYLRILRFFRFHAQYGEGEPDAEGLAAVTRLKDGLTGLSAERIGAEMRKLVAARGAVATLEAMAASGVMPQVLVPRVGLAPFAALRALDALCPNTRAPALALAALSEGGEAELDALADRLRLSNAERRRMKAARLAADAARMKSWDAGPQAVDLAALELLYRHGREAATDGVLLAAAEAGLTAEDAALRALLAAVATLDIPRLPLSGGELTKAGVAPGPKVGEGLRLAETRWIESGFSLDRAALVSAVLGRN
ncbi:CCA tRNA nucleotidyltransferase [Stappia indica]|uniref:CCA tRNA nucleotidyltransferase n=1 Tax=Stappia indica TaxID=538381 RepID=A0A857C643_9HYPH|nr:CCA tRNA nucleotidyltransferase [Stappia indica]QGZ34394.1 CCA tRNA nucleotidyltransferase [Stappia indica]